MEQTALLGRFNFAVVAVENSGAQPTSATDAFLATLTEVLDAGAGVEAYQAIRALFESLPPTGYYETIVMTGHALAYGLLRAGIGPASLSAWLESDHRSARQAGVAGWSKVAEHDSGVVDVDALVVCTERVDAAANESDDVTIGLVARMAGRLRDNRVGIRLIETLAAQGERARICAAHAIAYDPEMDPPVSYFSAFSAAPAPATVPPARRLVWLLLSLLKDDSEAVRMAAQQAIGLAQHSWPDGTRRLVELSLTARHEPRPDGWIGPPEDDPVDDLDAEIDRALGELSARTGRAWTRADLPVITQQVLDRSVSGPRRPRGVEYALRFPQIANQRAGFLTWNPQVLEAEMAVGEPLAIRDSPRLFVSYRWSDRNDVNGAIDLFASRLWDLGYDIVFDRDPRHLDKQLNAIDVLLLLPGCTHIILLVTDELIEFARGRPHEVPSPLDLEWDFAQQLPHLRWLGIWYLGDELPPQLTPESVADLRGNSVAPMSPLFPECRFDVVATASDGSTTELTGLLRRDLREAIAGSVAAEINDATERPAVWTA